MHEWLLYPGTGPASDVGCGAGEGYTVNIPLQGESGDETWCSVAEHVVAPLARAFAPQSVTLSYSSRSGRLPGEERPFTVFREATAGWASFFSSTMKGAWLTRRGS